MSAIKDAENLKRVFHAEGAKTAQSLLSALLIWIFGVLLFLPMAAALGSSVGLLCTVLILAGFTICISKAVGGFKKLIDAFAAIPARKYLVKRGWIREDGNVVSKQVLYSIFVVILYLLYYPLLVNVNPAVSGSLLIIVVVFVFFFAVKAIRASRKAITGWLYS
ncbi:MAG: hypothetical protein NWF05_04435 [Candidatus Bathyarchaeota archaeon]|nr:hypothetical protein [Candidatus Bathyarchaeota archaeon]